MPLHSLVPEIAMTTYRRPTEIFIAPDRQRKDLGDIEEMKESLSRLGQIQPIVIERNNTLVAGERRLRAAIALGWTQIEVKVWEDLDDFTRQAIELEENLKRKQMEWQETVDAVSRYHELRKSQDPAWTRANTAAALGIAIRSVDTYVNIDTEIKRGNEKVKEASKLSVARGLTERATKRRGELEVESVLESHPTAPIAPASPERPKHEIINANFVEWAPAYTGPKFNFIHCDFPYGINAQDIQQGSAVERHGGYDDSPDVYWKLVETLTAYQENFITENAHMLFWLSWKYFEVTKQVLRAAGWKVLDYPCIWHKTDNAGMLPDPKRGPRYVNEVALFCSRGDRLIVQAVANTFGAPTESDVHMSIKPQAMLAHFFRMFIDDTSIVLDPTCGSGSAIRAAYAAGASRSLGLELNSGFALAAADKLASFRSGNDVD